MQSQLNKFEQYLFDEKKYDSLIDVFEKNVAKYPYNHYAISYGGVEVYRFTYAEVDKIVIQLAIKLKKEQGLSNNGKPVGFTTVDTFSASIFKLALLKLGIPVLLLSPTKTAEEIKNLLDSTETDIAFILDPTLAKLQTYDPRIRLFDPINYKALLKEPIDESVKFTCPTPEDYKRVSVIYHTSGSTSYPKVRKTTNEYQIMNIQQIPLSPIDYDKSLLPNSNSKAMSGFPGFHMVGDAAEMSMVQFGGCMVYYPLRSSAEFVLKMLVEEECDYWYAVPSTLEAVAKYLQDMEKGAKAINVSADERQGIKERREQYIAALRKLNFLGYGGGALPEKIGNYLTGLNINLCVFYGMTEIGIYSSANIKKDQKKDYSLMRPINRAAEYAEFIPFPNEKNVFQLVIRKGCPLLANNITDSDMVKHNTNSKNPDSSEFYFETGDFFEESATGSNWWRSTGRRDDTLVLLNTLNFNPLMLEEAVRSDNIVQACAVVGEGRPCTAILVELKMDSTFLSSYHEKKSNSEIPNEVYKAVEKAVENANKKGIPSHGKIIPGMIYVLPIGKKLPATDKGTLPRKKAVMMFKDEINAMYTRYEKQMEKEASVTEKARDWTLEKIQQFIIEKILTIIPDLDKLSPADDLFDCGLDSQGVVMLINKVKDYLIIPPGMVYHQRTPEAIANALYSGSEQDVKQNVEDQYERTESILKELLIKAEKDFGVAQCAPVKEKQEVVLLTGATGTVGSFILQELLRSKKVRKVIALVREKENVELKQRLLESSKSLSLNVSLISEALETNGLEVLPLNLEAERLGFTQEKYDELKEDVTIIQACGWLLDFNQPVEHYKKHCIDGLYNLVKFAYRDVNPMRVHVPSSVSASVNAQKKDGKVLEKPLPRDPHVSSPMGYALSKYIAELLLNYMTKEKGVPCFIERLGQVCFASDSGVWNPSEQYPIMFKTGSQLKLMPQLNNTPIDWIPVDYAAKVIVELMLKPSKQCPEVENTIFHIVNPRPVTWEDILNSLKECGMEFEVVSLKDWVKAVSEDPKTDAHKLLPFYNETFVPYFTKFPLWDTKKTRESAKVLGQTPGLSSELMLKYIRNSKVQVKLSQYA